MLARTGMKHSFLRGEWRRMAITCGALAVACTSTGSSDRPVTTGTSVGDAGTTDATERPETSGPPAADTGAADAEAQSCDAAAALPPSSDAAQCTGGKLVAAAPVTITTPDPDPSNPTLAASPSGDRFLAVWTDGGGTLNGVAVPETLWMSMVVPGDGGVATSAAVQIAANGACPVAAWNATGFAVVWGDDAGMRLQQVDATGGPVGAPSLLLSRPNVQACPASLVATDSGLAIGWYEGQSVLQENVGLVGADGTIDTQVQLDAVGPGVSGDVALAELDGETYAAFVEWPGDGGSSVTAVARIDWSQGTAVPQRVASEFLTSLVAADGQLWFTTYGGGGLLLYSGAPGGAFPTAIRVCEGSGEASLAADGCGRVVEVGVQGNTPAGVATGFFVQPLQGGAPPVNLGDVTGSAVVGAASTFGVLWYARIGPGVPFPGDEPQTGTLSFTTLSWQ